MAVVFHGKLLDYQNVSSWPINMNWLVTGSTPVKQESHGGNHPISMVENDK